VIGTTAPPAAHAPFSRRGERRSRKKRIGASAATGGPVGPGPPRVADSTRQKVFFEPASVVV